MAMLDYLVVKYNIEISKRPPILVNSRRGGLTKARHRQFDEK